MNKRLISQTEQPIQAMELALVMQKNYLDELKNPSKKEVEFYSARDIADMTGKSYSWALLKIRDLKEEYKLEGMPNGYISKEFYNDLINGG